MRRPRESGIRGTLLGASITQCQLDVAVLHTRQQCIIECLPVMVKDLLNDYDFHVLLYVVAIFSKLFQLPPQIWVCEVVLNRWTVLDFGERRLDCSFRHRPATENRWQRVVCRVDDAAPALHSKFSDVMAVLRADGTSSVK